MAAAKGNRLSLRMKLGSFECAYSAPAARPWLTLASIAGSIVVAACTVMVAIMGRFTAHSSRSTVDPPRVQLIVEVKEHSPRVSAITSPKNSPARNQAAPMAQKTKKADMENERPFRTQKQAVQSAGTAFGWENDRSLSAQKHQFPKKREEVESRLTQLKHQPDEVDKQEADLEKKRAAEEKKTSLVKLSYQRSVKMSIHVDGANWKDFAAKLNKYGIEFKYERCTGVMRSGWFDDIYVFYTTEGLCEILVADQNEAEHQAKELRDIGCDVTISPP